jgi:hypothetical protein
MHAKRTLLTLALALALLSGGLPGAQASLLEDAVDAAGGGGELTAHKDLYHQDAEGTVSFENLEQRVLDNATTVKMLDETIASIDATDFDKMYDDLRDGLNGIAAIQQGLILAGQKGTYTYDKLADQYAAMEQTFDDLKEGKLQTDAEAAKRQLQDAKNQTVMGAETLYIAILEMQNTRQGLQRQLDAMDRSVAEMELRYQLGQISALTLQQVKDGRTQLQSGLATLEMNLANYTRQLEVMLGLPQTGTLILEEVPKVSKSQVEEMSLEEDLAAAKEKSYTLYAAKRDLDEAKETYDDARDQYGTNDYQRKSAEHTYAAAQYTYQSSLESFELNFRTAFAAVADYQQVLEASESALAYQQSSYAASELKYQQGTISKNTLLTAQDDLRAAEDAVTTARHNLFSAYNTYLWAVEYGILN